MKNYVRLCRPRFDIILLEIEADEVEDAETQALSKAIDGEISESAWHLQPYDDELYEPHVQRSCSARELEADPEDDADEGSDYLEELRSLDKTEHVRYLLLYADVGTGEGQVLFQPWFPEYDPSLLEHDLAGDWILPLQSVGEEGAENLADFAREQAEKSTAEILDTQRPIVVDLTAIIRSRDPPDPRQYKTEIPELIACPLTRTEHDDVIACLHSIDKVMSKSQSVVMRVELAAALLAHAGKAAYDSAAATGHPQDAQKLYDLFERIAVQRSRELYGQDRA